MGILNDRTAVFPSPTTRWRRTAVVLGCIGLALAVLLSYPPAFESARMLFGKLVANTGAPQGDSLLSPAEVRRQQLSHASTAVHGSFVKDAYGCVYVFQYIAAKLTLTPVFDDQNRPVCGKT